MAAIRAVLDTNILISALLFGGKPRKIFQLALQQQIQGITSPVLLAELNEILRKKFSFEPAAIAEIETKIKKKFQIVNPTVTFDVLADTPDNRVLEAAYEGSCDWIITGDRELLNLKEFKKIKILTVNEFFSK